MTLDKMIDLLNSVRSSVGGNVEVKAFDLDAVDFVPVTGVLYDAAAITIQTDDNS